MISLQQNSVQFLQQNRQNIDQLIRIFCYYFFMLYFNILGPLIFWYKVDNMFYFYTYFAFFIFKVCADLNKGENKFIKCFCKCNFISKIFVFLFPQLQQQQGQKCINDGERKSIKHLQSSFNLNQGHLYFLQYLFSSLPYFVFKMTMLKMVITLNILQLQQQVFSYKFVCLHFIQIYQNQLNKVNQALLSKYSTYKQCFVKDFSIIVLTFFIDNFGLNLGYYQLFILFVNQIITLILWKRKKVNYQRIQLYFIETIMWSEILIDDNQFNYFNQVVRVIVLLCSSDYLRIIYKEVEQYEYSKIEILFVNISLIASIIYFLCFFVDLFKVKYRVRDYDDLKLVTMHLNEKELKFKMLYISVSDYPVRDDIDYYLQEQMIFNFWQTVSYQIQQKKYVYICGGSSMLNPLNLDVLTEVNHIDNNLLNILNLKHTTEEFDRLILLRSLSGFFKDKFTINYFKNKTNKQDKTKKLYLKITSDMMRINAYNKHIKKQMLYNPNNILYDLYDK